MPLRVRRLIAVTGTTLATTAVTMTSVVTSAAGTAWTAGPRHASVVLARPGHLAEAVAAVRATGGSLGRPLAIVNGFTAQVSTAAAQRLNGSASVVSVTPDSAMTSASATYDPAVPGASAPASTRATSVWSQGNQGAGSTVAVLDTGVASVPDLTARLISGPDFSGEGNSLQDSFGHGTVMAGLIAGDGASSNGAYPGIAPAARILSVKVAGRSGATDVSTVLAGLEWIGVHKAQYGIKVVSLSWGTDSHQSALSDPLDFAVEQLWGMGITVVVSAGNAGPGPMTITKPGDDPAVLTVGAGSDAGTASNTDDSIPDWTSRGPTADSVAKPDVVAPGRTLVAVRSPQSTVEQENPQALVTGGYIRGSGTSEATAVTAGGVALLLSARPGLSPDEVKYALTSTAHQVSTSTSAAQGMGFIRLSRAVSTDVSDAPVQELNALGVGSLEGSRGSMHVSVICQGDTVPTVIEGEIDAQCNAFDSQSWSSQSWSSQSWSSQSWSSQSWSSQSWSSQSWSSQSWSSQSWSSQSWSGDTWDPAPTASPGQQWPH